MTNAPTITSLEPAGKAEKKGKGAYRESGPINVELPLEMTAKAKKAAELSPFTESEIRAMIRKAALKHLAGMPTVQDIVNAAIDELKAGLEKI